MRSSLAALNVRMAEGFKKPGLLAVLMLTVLLSAFFSVPVSATDYSLSLTTDSSISLSFPNNSTTTIDSSSIRVTTTCRAGYDLTLSTSISDNNLYRGGDSTNNTSGTYFSPSNGTVALSSATNTWGYLLSSTLPTASSVFLPVPTSNASPAVLKTASQTASQTDIDDTFSIYYGANADASLTSGTYKMAEDSTTHDNGTLIYYLTTSPNCTDSLDITFNKNLDGQGGETDPGNTVSNFPDPSENTLDLVNHTLTLSNKTPLRTNYNFVEWNTESDGSGDAYDPGDTISIGSSSPELSGSVTLYAIWEEATLYMQNLPDSACTTTPTVVTDRRDGEEYTIQRIPDANGHCWMLDNLRLGDDTDTYSLTPADTNINANFTLPASTSTFPPKATYDKAINTSNRDTTVANAYGIGSGLIGTYYNFCAASGGTLCDNTTTGNAQYDICPRGWRLPTGGSSAATSEHQALYNGYGSAANFLTGASMVLGGYFDQASNNVSSKNSSAYYWSSIDSNSGNKTYDLVATTSKVSISGGLERNGLSIRCLLDTSLADNSAEVTVNFAGTGISSISFSDGTTTQTASTSGGTITLTEGISYTITANTTAGYRLATWSTGANGTLGSTTANPTTYTISDDTSLTATGESIPTYTTTVNMDSHTASVSFYNADYGTTTATNSNVDDGSGSGSSGTDTVTLREGVSYTITASYTNGYTLDTWVTTAGGTLGSTVATTTTYVVTSNTTLSVTAQEADEVAYNLVYDTGSGTDGPSTDTATSYQAAHNFAISNTAPIYFGYNFLGWSETSGGSTVDYTSGDTITVSSTGATTTKTLYAVYEQVAACPTGKICYYDNGADVLNGGRGTMANQSASSNASVNLIPTNYSREGYGFAGWITTENSIPYGPNANITTGDLSGIGLSLYAKWVKSTGDLQTWNSCDNLSQNEVTALTDLRDDQTYLVSKLGDNHCWITENLRLDPSSADLSNQYTHSPASGFATAAASSSSSNILCNTADSAACTDQLQYNTNNLDRTLTQAHNANTDASAWYSYGVYYNWFTATAGNGVFNTNSGNVTGDICPAGWHLPTSTSSGEVAALNTAINSGRTNNDSGLRAYPANFLWSGDYNNNKRTNTYVNGRMWTATAYSNNNGYRLGYASSTVTPNGNYNKWDAFAVRCIYDGDTHTYNDVTVTLPQGASSVTFTNPNYGTEIANSGNTTVSLVQGATYTVTANLATGYEFSTWTNGQNSTLGNTNENPTTIVITDDTTLTPVVAEIPSYTVTVSIDSHITGVSFTNATYGTQNVTTNGGTASLRRGVSYTVTATLDTGYEATWSTTANGTLSSTTYNSATYTVSNEATLTVAVQQAPTYQVTVNMDSHVSNVAFYNADLGTQSVSTNGGTASLSRNVAYTVTASFASGYEIDTWSTTANGTLSSTVTNPTTYTVTGASILTVASKEIPIMQDYTLSRCSNEAASGNVTLLDSRDNSDYTVRYINGECWMTQNLRIVGTISATGSNFSGNNFNVSEYSLDRSDSSYTNHCDDTNGYNYACAKDSNSTTMGVWYNYYAATAGTIATNSNTTVATEDICPTGWHLPTGDVSVNSDTYKLLGEHTSGYVWPANYPSIAAFNPVHGGYYRLGSLRNSGASKTSWWSATPARSIEETSRYILSYDLQDSSFNVNDTGIRHLGFFVRCVKDKDTIGNGMYMQDVTSTQIANTPTDVTYILKDKRDETEYTVAKLQDGNLWMTQNLELGEYGTSMNLTRTLSNVSSSGYTLNLSYPYASDSKGNSNKYGNFYSWYEATVESGTNTSGTNATYDICPKGWRLPRTPSNKTDSEFYKMLNHYITTGTQSNADWYDITVSEITDLPVSLVFSGWGYTNDSPVSQGSNGCWWTSTYSGSGFARQMSIDINGRVYLGMVAAREDAGTVRCLMPGSQRLAALIYHNFRGLWYNVGYERIIE